MSRTNLVIVSHKVFHTQPANCFDLLVIVLHYHSPVCQETKPCLHAFFIYLTFHSFSKINKNLIFLFPLPNKTNISSLSHLIDFSMLCLVFFNWDTALGHVLYLKPHPSLFSPSYSTSVFTHFFKLLFLLLFLSLIMWSFFYLLSHHIFSVRIHIFSWH